MHWSNFTSIFLGVLFTEPVIANVSSNEPYGSQQLTDYEQIQQKLNLYGVIVDTKSWPRFKELFTNDVTTTSVNGNFSGYEPVTKNIIQFIQNYDSQHLLGTTQIQISHDGKSADTFSYAKATVWARPLVSPGQVVYLSAAYTDHFLKTKDGWKIKNRHFADVGPAAGNLTVLSG